MTKDVTISFLDDRNIARGQELGGGRETYGLGKGGVGGDTRVTIQSHSHRYILILFLL